ncbi:GIY-YIG nuclease family protein [Vibrio splendidus]
MSKHSVTVQISPLLIKSQVQQSPYLVYLLELGSLGTYVGMTSDFMTRWDYHQSSAYNANYTGTCNENLRKAIKRCPAPKFYIVALADTKEKADDLEALAIDFYKPSLNTQPEYSTHKTSYSFAQLKTLSKRISIVSKRSHGNNHHYTDSERDMYTCQMVWNKSKLRVQIVEGIHKGKYVECSKTARSEHALGTRVKVKAVLKSTGTCLVAPKTDRLLPV